MEPNNNPNIKHPAVKKKEKVVTYQQLVPEGWQKKTQNCHYVFVTGNGVIRRNIADVCFAYFRSDCGIIKGKFLINQHNTPSTYFNNAKYINDEKFRAKLLVWINWIVKHSPLRYAFTNGKTDFLKHGLNFNCSVPHKYVFAACNAIREGWEFPWRVNFWHSLVDAGVSKELSYYVVSMLSADGKIIGGQGHSLLQHVPSGRAFDWFRKLTLKSIKAIEAPMSTGVCGINGVSALFSSGKNTAHYKDVFEGDNLKTLLGHYGTPTRNEWGDKVMEFDVTNAALITRLKEIDNA